MPFAAALSQHPLATHAVGEVVGQVLDEVGHAPDAAIVFVTGGFAGAMEDIAATIRATLEPGALIGATAVSVLAGGQEVEEQAAISLFAMRFGPLRSPGTSGLALAVPIHVHPNGDGWSVTADVDLAIPDATVVLLADPHSFPTEAFIDEVTSRAPGLTVVGGLASAAPGPGGNRLVADETVATNGAVALVLSPVVGAQALVSQGCEPVGEPLVITKAQGNIIEEIAGQPALDRLMEQAEQATPEDRTRMARSLQVGFVLDERKVDFERDDFLVRPVLGADHERRAVAVGAEVEVGSTIQFQVRDHRSADEDLHHVLAGLSGAGALVFSCRSRGTTLFPEPDHDAGLVDEHVEGSATAGMFCDGEIGPVGGRHAVHAMSACVLLFDDRL